MKIDIDAIKDLRAKTGAGIADCRQALTECQSDVKKAVEWLRMRGMEKAVKKADRQVKAGMVFAYVHHTGRLGSMVGLACETDFVAKTDDFGKLGKELAMQAAASGSASIEEFLEQEYVRDPSRKVGDLVKETIGKLGENIQILEITVVRV